jgi:signal peptidase II
VDARHTARHDGGELQAADMIWLQAIVAAVAVTAADQASKAAVLTWRPVAAIASRSFVAIRCTLNRRGALVPFLPVRTLVVLWVAVVVLAGLALGYGALGHDMRASLGLGAIVGGATGNLLDRLRHGAIVDFIAIGPWPLFNLADAAIVAGGGLVLLSLR